MDFDEMLSLLAESIQVVALQRLRQGKDLQRRDRGAEFSVDIARKPARDLQHATVCRLPAGLVVVIDERDSEEGQRNHDPGNQETQAQRKRRFGQHVMTAFERGTVRPIGTL
jgi:hypothetical protein